MSQSVWFKPPTLFVFLSFTVALLNVVDNVGRQMYALAHMVYPLGLFLKPFLFSAQVIFLIMFVRRVRFMQKPVVSGSMLSRFFSIHLVLLVGLVLLYVDFPLNALSKMNSVNVVLELAVNLIYLTALSGSSLWFASRVFNQAGWKWLSVVFVLIGVAFATVFLDKMFFWSQSYAGLVFPDQLALIGTYGPLVLMFLAAMATATVLLKQASAKNSPALKISLSLLVPAFLVPSLWDGYREGLINFVIRDLFDYGFGYISREWYSVSFLLMSVVAYAVVLRELSRRLGHTFASSLIVLGVASFPLNGIVPLTAGFSSIPGNVISLSSIITGATLLKIERGKQNVQ